VVGTWQHTAEMRPLGRLPLALAGIGLLRTGHAAVAQTHGNLVAVELTRTCRSSPSANCVDPTVKAVRG
jgi:hypothetical protein